MTKKKDDLNEGVTIEIKAVRDSGVEGGSRIRFVFPDKPKDAARAIYPEITGAIWMKAGAVIPDKLLIKIPKVKEEEKKGREKDEEADDHAEKDDSGEFV